MRDEKCVDASQGSEQLVMKPIIFGLLCWQLGMLTSVDAQHDVVEAPHLLASALGSDLVLVPHLDGKPELIA
jgi:hypothetical protein